MNLDTQQRQQGRQISFESMQISFYLSIYSIGCWVEKEILENSGFVDVCTCVRGFSSETSEKSRATGGGFDGTSSAGSRMTVNKPPTDSFAPFKTVTNRRLSSTRQRSPFDILRNERTANWFAATTRLLFSTLSIFQITKCPRKKFRVKFVISAHGECVVLMLDTISCFRFAIKSRFETIFAIVK